MQGLGQEVEKFKFAAMGKMEPVERFEERSYVIASLGKEDNARSYLLDGLEGNRQGVNTLIH